MSRMYYIRKNIIFSAICQSITMLLSFVARAIFIHFLGVKYLGVSSLFTNIISFLSLAELGVGAALTFHMYEPLATGDKEKLTSIIQLYKKLYTKIGIFILVVGICLLPGLKYIVNTNLDMDEVYIFYIMYLLDSVISYFYVYKTTIITADQKDYKIKQYKLLMTVIKFVIQSLMIVIFKNFVVYLIVQIAVTFITNVYISNKATNMYPYINEKRDIDESLEKKIWKTIRASFLYNFGAVIINNEDNILISKLVSTDMIGYCSNYTMIFHAFKNITNIIFSSLIPSVGNLYAESEKEHSFAIFEMIMLMSYCIYGTITVIICVCSQDFISLWLGNKYVLSQLIVFAMAMDFYSGNRVIAVQIYRNATGLFEKIKYLLFITGIVNLVLSILLGVKFGAFGIYIATVLSRLVTGLWFEPMQLYKLFQENVKTYFSKRIIEDLLMFLTLCICLLISSRIVIVNSWVSLFVKGMICVLIYGTVIVIFFSKRKEYKSLIKILKKEINKIRGRISCTHI